MNQPQIQIPLDLPNVRVEKYEQTDKGLVITVVRTSTTAVCRQCGRTIDKFYGYDKAVTLRHLPIFDRPVWIRIRPKRFQCPYCDKGPTTTQRCEWYEPKSPHTQAYENWILRELVNSTLSDVSLKRNLSVECIEGILDRHIQREVDWSAVPYLALLGIDEIALKKGHKDFVVIVSGLNAADRDHDASRGEFLELPEDYWLGYGWEQLIEALRESLVDHRPRVCQQDQMIHFKQIESVGDHLLIDYPGDNEWVMSQIDMLMHYARRVDETTGDAKPVER